MGLSGHESCLPYRWERTLNFVFSRRDAANPFIIEGVTVRWMNSAEFGLSFTNVRPGVQKQIAQLCRTRTM